MRELHKGMKRDLPVESDGRLAVYAFPGGYPIVYQALSNNPYHRDEVLLCPKCAQEQEDKRNKPVCPDCGSPLTDQDGKPVTSLDQIEPALRGLVCSSSECDWTGGKDDIAEYDVLSAFTHDEGAPIDCEACSESVESSYGDPEEEKLFDRVRDVLREDQEAKTALLSALPVEAPLGHPGDDSNVLVYRTQPSPYSAPAVFEYHLTDTAVKQIVGAIGSMVPGFWDRASNSVNDEWEQDITFASVSMALQSLTAQAQNKGKDQE